MAKKKYNVNNVLLGIIVTLIVLILVVIFMWNYQALKNGNYSFLTGKATDVGMANVTWSGTAGMQVTGNIQFGSGYFNSSCNSSGATLDSNRTYDGNYFNLTLWNATSPAIFPYCWINTTAILDSGNNKFTVVNNGSYRINVSVISNYDGEEWLCGMAGCSLTEIAAAEVLSINGENSACGSGLTSGYESMVTAATNNTVGLCDSLDYQDSSDALRVFLNITIPKDTTSGTHNLNLTFQGIAV